jgi:putative ABC transport system permease protein
VQAFRPAVIVEGEVGQDDELDKELQFHVESRIDDLIAAGRTPDEARRQARLEFGGVMQTKEAVRDLHLRSLVDGIWQDLRLALRTLRATPIVTVIAVLSLALGIGANTAMFSLVNSLLLRALPVKEPARLVLLRSREPNGYPEWSYPVWSEIQRRPQLFESAAAWSPVARANFTVAGVTTKADGLFASGSFFDTLGVPAFVGRAFSEADDQRGGGPDGPVAVVSYGFWQRQFGADIHSIGRPIVLENVAFTIVGVMPPEFFGADVGRSFDVIVPLGTEPLVSRSEGRLGNAATSWLNIMARLKPEQTLDAATAAVRSVRDQILDATIPQEWPAHLIDSYRKRPFLLAPAATGDSSVRERYQRPLVTIMVVVVLVLAIACANIANLLLARATARRHELSLRVALGASRWRLVRQLFTESVVLAGAGAAVGVLLASWGSRFVVSQISTEARPVVLDLSMDRHVLLFTIGVAAATALLFGVAPALQASGVAPMEAMKDHGTRHSSGEGRRGGVTSGLVVAQVALSVVLVVAAGLFVRTFASLATRPLGFDRDRVLVTALNAHSAAIDPSQRLTLYERATEAVRALPGVAGAAVSYQTPPVEMISIIPVDTISGGTVLLGMERMNPVNLVAPGWFSTLGTRLVEGRDVTDRDRAGTPRVALANQTFARKFLNGASPLGRTITSTVGQPPLLMSIEIVGVVEDAVFGSLRRPQHPMLYVPIAQANWLPSGMLAQVDLSVRASGTPPTRLAASVAAAVHGVSPDLVVTFRSLTDQVNATLSQERIVALLSGFFGVLALLLAGLGLYGVTAYAVARRRTEIGIRMALGAAPAGVIRMVLSRVTALVGIGVLVGAGVSLWASRFVAALLYGLEPRDPVTLAGAALVLAAVGAIAGWLPAHRASRIDPAVVLRDS